MTVAGPARPGTTAATVAFALSTVGVAVVAWAYAAARAGYGGAQAGYGGAQAGYWAGQALVFLPVAGWLLAARRVAARPAALLVVGLAANQYLLKWAYSPLEFRFPDELQHWAATTTLVRTGLLFTADPGLPAAVHYPGLEEMAAAVVGLTGLPVTAAGLVVAGVARLVFVAALYATVAAAGARPRTAALACVVYATGLHYLFFDAMFLYQSAALPFLMLAVWATRYRRGTGVGAVALGAVAILVATVSHHVTSAVLAGTLALLAGFDLLRRAPGRRRTLLLAGVAALAVAGWVGLAARDVLAYLGSPARTAVASVLALVTGDGQAPAAAPAGSPLWSMAVQGGCLLALFGLYLAGARALVRGRRYGAWRCAVLAGGLLFFAGSALRFFGAQGPELAGRAATFTFVPMSVLAAGVLAGWRERRRVPGPGRRAVAVPVLAALGMLALLATGARLGGWPPAWGRLPGPGYLVGGYERAVDPLGVAAARWSRNWLGADQRVAADLTGAALIFSYGGADPVASAARLYDDLAWGFADEEVLQDLAVTSLWVDLRTATSAPADRVLFLNDPRAGRRDTGLGRDRLAKFDALADIARVYDNGTIRIYDMGRV